MKLAVDILNSAIKSYEYSIKGLDIQLFKLKETALDKANERYSLEQKITECKKALELLEGKSE